MADYLEQFKRVERWLARIEKQNRGSTEYDDDLWAFFQNCWHLKDWLKYDDAAVPETLRNSLEGYFASAEPYPNIRICADLANRTKHLKLRRRPRVDAKFTQRNVKVAVGSRTTSTSEHIITLEDGTKRVALAVARQAVKEWKRILSDHGLSTA